MRMDELRMRWNFIGNLDVFAIFVVLLTFCCLGMEGIWETYLKTSCVRTRRWVGSGRLGIIWWLVSEVDLELWMKGEEV